MLQIIGNSWKKNSCNNIAMMSVKYIDLQKQYRADNHLPGEYRYQ